MKLNYITILVRDLEQSAAFYQDLAGLSVVRRIQPEGGEIAFLANGAGETMIELVRLNHAGQAMAKGLTLSFLCEGDLDTLRRKAESLGYAPSAILEMGAKPKHFTLTDPDGIPVEFGL